MDMTVQKKINEEPYVKVTESQKSFIKDIKERYQNRHKYFILIADLILGTSGENSVKFLNKVPKIVNSSNSVVKLLAIFIQN